MKIKQDFVTNSSSTCYIIALPMDIQVKSEDNDLNIKLEKYLNYIKSGGVVDYGMEADYAEYNIYFTDYNELKQFYDEIYNILDKYSIVRSDHGADYSDMIININSERMKNKMELLINEYEKHL